MFKWCFGDRIRFPYWFNLRIVQQQRGCRCRAIAPVRWLLQISQPWPMCPAPPDYSSYPSKIHGDSGVDHLQQHAACQQMNFNWKYIKTRNFYATCSNMLTSSWLSKAVGKWTSPPQRVPSSLLYFMYKCVPQILQKYLVQVVDDSYADNGALAVVTVKSSDLSAFIPLLNTIQIKIMIFCKVSSTSIAQTELHGSVYRPSSDKKQIQSVLTLQAPQTVHYRSDNALSISETQMIRRIQKSPS